MITRLVISFLVMSLCVTVHAVGSVVALRYLDQSSTLQDRRLWRQTWLLVRLAVGVIFLHILDIFAWGALYTLGDAMPDARTAVYFSSVTYTTVGYGDFVLPAEWRLVGGIEALTGILMCGWSTGFFFSVVSRLHSQPLLRDRSQPAVGERRRRDRRPGRGARR